jgi:hypothetical protein
MAISSLDQLIAANAAGRNFKYIWCKQNSTGSALAAGKWSNTATWNGNPCAMIYTAGPVVLSGNLLGLSMVADSPVGNPATIGTIPHGGPVAPYIKYLTSIEVNGTVATTVPSWLLLVDILVTVPGIVPDTAGQTLNHPPLPRYTNGQGVMMFLEQYGVASGTISSAIDITGTGFLYTNASGLSGQTIPWSVQAGGATANSASNLVHSGVIANDCGPFLPLAAGDVGVQSVQRTKFTGAQTGTCCLVLCKPLAQIPLHQALYSSGRDYVFNIPTMPVIQDGACLAFLVYSGAALATNATLHASLDFVWG